MFEGEKATIHTVAARTIVEADDGCLFALEEASVPFGDPETERILKRLTKFTPSGVQVRSSAALHTRLLTRREALADMMLEAGFARVSFTPLDEARVVVEGHTA